ncbi:carbon-nitrogen hydrolase family protein, partial [Vibrio parahaemolyticus V-223/04]
LAIPVSKCGKPSSVSSVLAFAGTNGFQSLLAVWLYTARKRFSIQLQSVLSLKIQHWTRVITGNVQCKVTRQPT